MRKNMYGPLGLPPPLEVPLELVKAFCVIIARHTSQRREVERAILILELMKFNPSATARQLGCNREKAYRWYHRVVELLAQERPKMTDPELERFLHLFLKDNERSGAPLIYSPEQQCAIVAMASEKPRKYGVEADRWTHHELAMIANRDGVTNSISSSTVGRILNEADIKPHRICFVYTPKHCSWMNQIEIWFGILTRKILRYGNFKSTNELRERIESFIEYYNTTMAKVFKWTYKGKLLQA